MAGLALPRRSSPALVRFASWRAEFARRRVLASRPQPQGVHAPSWRLLIAELRSGYESWRAWRALSVVEAQDRPATEGVPVILLPGFGTHPVRMWRLRDGLRSAGHQVGDWGLGWNWGGSADKLDRLVRRVEREAERAGQPVALVGWSLGGLYAREAAKRAPHAVRLVVTLGSPFSGDMHANNAWRAYHWIAGQDVSEPIAGCDYAAKPPVPTHALWSACDGIVAPRSARGRAGERDSAVALRCTHLGFAGHPRVVEEVLRLLR